MTVSAMFRTGYSHSRGDRDESTSDALDDGVRWPLSAMLQRHSLQLVETSSRPAEEVIQGHSTKARPILTSCTSADFTLIVNFVPIESKLANAYFLREPAVCPISFPSHHYTFNPFVAHPLRHVQSMYGHAQGRMDTTDCPGKCGRLARASRCLVVSHGWRSGVKHRLL